MVITSLVSRPHENASFRSGGILQYEWLQKAIDKNKNVTQGVLVTTSAACNTEMALEVAVHMCDGRNPGHSKPDRAGKRAKVQEPPSDPETKPWQEAVERIGKSVSTLKVRTTCLQRFEFCARGSKQTEGEKSGTRLDPSTACTRNTKKFAM